MTRSPTIAAALIVRDEARSIERCLKGVRPFVDRLLVVDTGSQDDTVERARAIGAEVHHLTWEGDFAGARNHALTLADADWTLVIDADEWIVGGGAELRAWCASGQDRLGQVAIDSLFGDGEQSSRGWVSRLLPRGVRYAGRVHEQPVSSLPRVRSPVVLGHDGYLQGRLPAKSARNRPLLLAELARHPGDPYILYQLGKDAAVAGEHDPARQWFAGALAAAPAEAAWRHDLVLGAIDNLSRGGWGEQALALADGEFPNWGQSPDFFFALGNVLLDRAVADPAGALDQWLPLARSAWERCLDIGERPELDGSVAGRGSHLAQHNLDVLRVQMGG